MMMWNTARDLREQLTSLQKQLAEVGAGAKIEQIQAQLATQSKNYLEMMETMATLKKLVASQAKSLESLEAYKGKVEYELMSLRNSLNRKLGSIARAKFAESQDGNAEITERISSKWDEWFSKLSPDEKSFVSNSPAEELERLKSMVESGQIT